MNHRAFSCLMIGCLLVAGCGDGGAAVLKRRSNLNLVGFAYHQFYAANDKAPGSAGELTTFMSSIDVGDADAMADAITSLEEGDIVLIYDGALGQREENGNFILGFEARAPASGGYVVMGDGTVQLMTGKEFSEATLLPQQPATQPE